MSFIVRYGKKNRPDKFEVYDVYKIAWDRYNELLEGDETLSLSLIQPANQEIHDQILQGTWDEA